VTGTISMPDSIYPQKLLSGYPAYLGYADGEWATAQVLAALFPHARHVILTVNGSTLVEADGADCEPGNIDAAATARWVRDKLATEPGERPVVYADLASEGYSMSEVLADLAALGIPRSRVRVLSAHYADEHICSPAHGCRDAHGNVITWTADGTQWTSTYPGAGGEIDMSMLGADFFGTPKPPPPPADWVFGPVRSLEVLSAGPHSVKLSWSSPAVAMPEAVGWYQVTVRHGGRDVDHYPRVDPKHANPETWQGGGLHPGTAYEAMVRAVAKDGGHASPWATVEFTTAKV
jgi:hypothetical protein